MCTNENLRQPDFAVSNAFAPVDLLEWTPEHSVGIAVIDQHHQRLFRLVNALHSALLVQQSQTRMASLLTDLIQSTQSHFTSEEVMMEAFGYPETELHRTEHENMLRTVQAFQEQFFRGEAEITVELMEFFKTWLHSHLLECDRKYMQFFAERGSRR
jgi:hemerythrin